MMDALRMSESSGGLMVSMSPASVRRSQSRLQLLAGLLLYRISGQLTSDGLHITKRGVLQMRHTYVEAIEIQEHTIHRR